MNIENLDTLIRALRTMQAVGNEQRFHMARYFMELKVGLKSSVSRLPPMIASADPTSCGTAACIAGWCQLLGAVTQEEKEMPAAYFARDWLGLGRREAAELFIGDWTGTFIEDITLHEVLAYLERLRARNAPGAEHRIAALAEMKNRELVDA